MDKPETQDIYGCLLPGKIVTSKDVGTLCSERSMVPEVCGTLLLDLDICMQGAV